MKAYGVLVFSVEDPAEEEEEECFRMLDIYHGGREAGDVERRESIIYGLAVARMVTGQPTGTFFVGIATPTIRHRPHNPPVLTMAINLLFVVLANNRLSLLDLSPEIIQVHSRFSR